MTRLTSGRDPEEAVLKKFTVVNKASGCVLGQAIERADTSKTRRKGLLKRSGLQKGEGLWIVPCESIHTFFMRFDIDVVFLDRNKKVVKLVERLRPWRLAMSWRARTVLELPPSAIAETGTKRGDQLEFVGKPDEDAQG